MKKKNILLFGNYGGQNWGDESILSGLLCDLPKNHFHITVVSSDPQKTKESYGIEAILPPPFGIRSLFSESLGVFSSIRKADIILFGGGGLFQDREKKAIFLWGYYWLCCKILKKKLVFVGNSVGPLSSFCSRFIAKRAFLSAPFISVRDESSQNLLLSLGIPRVRIALATDAAFCARKLPEPKTRKGTLLLFRGDGRITPDQIRPLLRHLPSPVSAIAMDKIDEDLAKDLGVSLKKPSSLMDLKREIVSARLVLSSRLHGGILALQAETPFCVFSAAPKVRHFFSQRGLFPLLFEEDFEPEALQKKIRAIQRSFKKTQNILSKVRLQEMRKTKNILPLFLQK